MNLLKVELLSILSLLLVEFRFAKSKPRIFFGKPLFVYPIIYPIKMHKNSDSQKYVQTKIYPVKAGSSYSKYSQTSLNFVLPCRSYNSFLLFQRIIGRKPILVKAWNVVVGMSTLVPRDFVTSLKSLFLHR